MPSVIESPNATIAPRAVSDNTSIDPSRYMDEVVTLKAVSAPVERLPAPFGVRYDVVTAPVWAVSGTLAPGT